MNHTLERLFIQVLVILQFFLQKTEPVVITAPLKYVQDSCPPSLSQSLSHTQTTVRLFVWFDFEVQVPQRKTEERSAKARVVETRESLASVLRGKSVGRYHREGEGWMKRIERASHQLRRFCL